ncbi:hypothetical protein F5Y16DRAFT_391524 [Xylariaceae sp. FL0255]|nr:hypothetical protein F5Y16DRAFT_391524 [Xylariaceae sp. FL0255]
MHLTSISASESGKRKYPLREPVKRAWAELGVAPNFDKTNGSIFGMTEMYENSKDGMRQPSQSVFPLDDVEVRTKTIVRRVLFDGKAAKEVELANGSKISARKEVIICTGTYRTPQVLMLSGIGLAAVLEEHGIPIVHDAPKVGQNLHDHFDLYLAFRLRDPTLGYALGSPAWQSPALFKGLPWDWVVSGSLPDEIKAKHGIELKENRNYWETISLYVPPGLPGIPFDGTHIATSTMLLIPTSRSSVTIRSINPYDAPSINPNYISTELDRDSLVYAGRQALELMLSTEPMKSILECEAPISGDGFEGLEPLTATASDEAILDRIRRTGMQHHHSGGTAAMGDVVDTQGKVIGVRNLRIADASIVPIPLGGHPQATLYAMVEQLADIMVNEMME